MIPFTQFVLPNGRRKTVTIDHPDREVEALAVELISAGFKFEIEVLRNGQVSMDCTLDDDGDGVPVAMEICDNGPAVAGAVARLVRTAHEAMRFYRSELH